MLLAGHHGCTTRNEQEKIQRPKSQKTGKLPAWEVRGAREESGGLYGFAALAKPRIRQPAGIGQWP